MDLNEKKKSDVFRWLVSMSQYKTGLFGLGRVIHYTEYHSRLLLYLIL